MPLGRGSAVGRKFLALPYHSQRAVFTSPLSAFFFVLCLSSRPTLKVRLRQELGIEHIVKVQ